MTPSPRSTAHRRTFRRLHEAGCFVIPNPWDAGTTRYLQHLGFHALATTSAGAAFSLGLPDSDSAVPRDVMLAHIRSIVEASDVPVNADFQSGYADEPEGVAENVRLCLATGVAGLSLEDASGVQDPPLYDVERAVARLRAARAAIDEAGCDVVLTARCETFLVGAPDLGEAVRRLVAYAAAGADCLYAPGIRTSGQIKAIVRAVAPKPVNVLASGPGFTVRELADLGVRRVSVGSALARTAWGAFVRSAQGIAAAGSFDGLAAAIPFAELDGFFRADGARRARS